MTSVTRLSDLVDVVIGVDTHVKTHSACAVHAVTGAVLDQITVPATPAGYRELVEFADLATASLGEVPAGQARASLASYQAPAESAEASTGWEMDLNPAIVRMRAWAIESTGSHGAGLARHLAAGEELVFELDRPERAKRRGGRKSDPLDAQRAAREALARPRLGTPRGGSGPRQALSVLLSVRASAVQAATDAQRQLFAHTIAAPDEIRERLRGRRGEDLLRAAAGIRGHATWDAHTQTTALTLRTLAKRALTLIAEARDHERQIRALVRDWRPDLLAEHGVGPIVAATILCAWSHPGRIHSEAGFAMLAGTAPIPASSGQTERHRLNRYGDRQLNRAITTIVMTRLRGHGPTQAYQARRLAEGKTRRETRRCLKRYVTRDIFRKLEHPLDAT